MYDSEQTRQGGQSFTLDVKRDPKTQEAVVSCEVFPDLGETRDEDQQFAVQQMKQKIDEHLYRTTDDRVPMIVGHRPRD